MTVTPAERERQIAQLLSEREIRFRIYEHMVSRTVADAEAYLPFPVEQLLKTVVFQVKGGPWFLVACRGQDRIDYRKVAAVAGIARANIVWPAPDEVERVLGFENGGICPFSPDGLAETIVDAEAATTLDVVYCGIGRNDRTLELRLADLIAVSNARVVSVVREADS